MMSVFGPGSERSEEEREQIWEVLGECVRSCERGLRVAVIGDVNARVGDLSVDGMMGPYSFPRMNKSGERLIEMCIEQELIFGSTWFKTLDIRKCP